MGFEVRARDCLCPPSTASPSSNERCFGGGGGAGWGVLGTESICFFYHRETPSGSSPRREGASAGMVGACASFFSDPPGPRHEERRRGRHSWCARLLSPPFPDPPGPRHEERRLGGHAARAPGHVPAPRRGLQGQAQDRRRDTAQGGGKRPWGGVGGRGGGVYACLHELFFGGTSTYGFLNISSPGSCLRGLRRRRRKHNVKIDKSVRLTLIVSFGTAKECHSSSESTFFVVF